MKKVIIQSIQKIGIFLNRTRNALVLAFLLVFMTFPPKIAYNCKGSPCPTPPPTNCFNSITVVKGVGGVFLVPAAPFVLNIPVRINTYSGPSTAPQGICPATCPNPATVTGGNVSVTLTLVGIGVGGPFTGTAPLPPRGSGFQTGVVQVPVTITAGTLGAFLVQAVGTANFSASGNPGTTVPPQTLSNNGDMTICFVEPSPANPSVPRLELVEVGTPGTNLLCTAGTQVCMIYNIINNDPNQGVTLNATATSEQEADMPNLESGNNPELVLAISNVEGFDDFPIQFAESCDDVLILPPDPATFEQPPLTLPSFFIPAGDTIPVIIQTASFPQCADGSCNQFTFTVEGFFDDGSPALACIAESITIKTGAICPSAGEIVPTLSEWGIILFTLFLLAFGIVFIRRSQRQLAFAGAMEGSSTMNWYQSESFKNFPITLLITIVFVSATIFLWYGFISTLDIVGILLSSLILAYLWHYLKIK